MSYLPPQQIPQQQYSLRSPLPPPVDGALIAAVSKNDVEAVSNLLQRGADVNERVKLSSTFDAMKKFGDGTLGEKFEGKGNTPLHLAVIRNNPDIVQLLIRNGADLDAQNPAGNTPLQLAKNPNISKLLLEKGASASSAKGGKYKRKSRKYRKSRKSRKSKRSRKSRKYRR
jgi:hypothetical protein